MSRERIAELLGRLDYGNELDDVDWRARLDEVDQLLDSGLVVDVDHLINPDVIGAWLDACDVLLPLGWKPLVTWPGQLEVKLVPPYVTSDRTDDLMAPFVTVDMAPNEHRRWQQWVTYSAPVWDTGDSTQERFGSGADLFDWLPAP